MKGFYIKLKLKFNLIKYAKANIQKKENIQKKKKKNAFITIYSKTNRCYFVRNSSTQKNI